MFCQLPASAMRADHDVHWPPSLDLEPEVCTCLRHGEELPCDACETASSAAKEESS
jgi:hypothetical protein